MKTGEYASITPTAFRELREKHGLTQVQIAVLGRSSFYKNRKGDIQARRVQAWEAGRNRIPLASWELIRLKLLMMEHGMATYEDFSQLAPEDLFTKISPKPANG